MSLDKVSKVCQRLVESMLKDFFVWHDLKSNIDRRDRTPFFHEREIWWCSLGLNIGAEENGKEFCFERPVLIFRKFNLELFWGIPLTSKKRTGIFYHPFVSQTLEGTLLLSQLRLLSGKRLRRRLGRMGIELFRKTNEAVQSLLKETDPLRDPRVP